MKLSEETWREVVRVGVDLALEVDDQIVIRSVEVGDAVADVSGWDALVGRPWPSVVGTDSLSKAEALVSAPAGRPREVNIEVAELGQFPFRFSSLKLDPRRLLLMGRDLRPISAMQQRMVMVQQAADREYARLRQSGTPYRLFFQACAEAAVVAESKGLKLVEANPAAAALFDATPADLTRMTMADLLEGPSLSALEGLVAAVSSGARNSELQVKLKGQRTPVTLALSLFRQSSTPLLLLRLLETSTSALVAGESGRRLQGIIQAMPDGFVMLGADRRVVSANPAFCEMVSRANEGQVLGESIERWLGRPGVDLKIMFANLKEHGWVRNFATIVRGEVGPPQEAMVTAIAVPTGDVAGYGFVVRPATPRLAAVPSALTRSVDQLRELVGRVPIKEIVRESADLVERLCIEAALDVSDNNRASAAQLLGLSRQGLYSKLRRYGLVESEPNAS